MKKVLVFLIFIYLVSIGGGWFFYTKIMQANARQTDTLDNTLKQYVTKTEQELATQKAENDMLKKKIADARAYASFISLALCPALESTNKEAPCVKNNTEWFAKTVEAGTVLPDQEAKDGMTALVLSLAKKTKPTAKQIYDTLKPIEVRTLNVLIENLQ